MVDFPAGDPDIPTAAATGETLANMHAGVGHPQATNRLLTNIKALGAKLGYGSSLPGATAAVLRRTASGQSGWGQVQAGDYGAGSVANADLAGSIAVAKLAGGGTANRIVRTTDGSTMVMGQLVGGDITDAQIGTNKLAANCVSKLQLSYALAADALSATTGNNWNILPGMNFTVDDASSLILVTVRIAALSTYSAGPAEGMASLYIDGALQAKLGMMVQGSASNIYGCWTGGMAILGPFAAGSHPIQVNLSANNNVVAYLRCASQPNIELCQVHVLELKR